VRIYTLSIPGSDSVSYDSIADMLDDLDHELVMGECPRQVIMQVDVAEVPYSEYVKLPDFNPDERLALHVVPHGPEGTHCAACGDQVRGRLDQQVRHLVETWALWAKPPAGFRKCKETP